MFTEVSEQEFSAFITLKDYKHVRVDAGPAVIDVYYDEPEYNPSLRDAFKATYPGGVTYHVKAQ